MPHLSDATAAARPAVVLVHDSASATHTMAGHPENAMRLEAIDRRIASDSRLAALPRIEPTGLEAAALLGVHTDSHLRAVESAARGGGGWLDADTYCTAASWDVALSAAGAAQAAAVAVGEGRAANAFALIRPPGHHATSRQAMGFCLLNNVAVAARAAQRGPGVERIAIVDIDVHHGNGTQEVFLEDPGVLFCSLHQFPLYPYSGRAGERGIGAGAATTVNVPLAAATGSEGWFAAFDEHVAPAVRAFRPGLILVSAGFDAHQADPLADLRLRTADYGGIARRITALAAEVSAAGTVWCLEGGYDLEALPASVAEVIAVLAGGGDATGGGTETPPAAFPG